MGDRDIRRKRVLVDNSNAPSFGRAWDRQNRLAGRGEGGDNGLIASRAKPGFCEKSGIEIVFYYKIGDVVGFSVVTDRLRIEE